MDEFARKALWSFFGILVVASAVLLVSRGVGADFNGSSCICYFTGPCAYDEDGVPYRYYQCTGACYAYSGWAQNWKCYQEGYPRELFS